MKTYTVDKLVKQIFEAEGVNVEINLLHPTIFVTSWKQMYPEPLSHDATVSDLQERIERFILTHQVVLEPNVIDFKVAKRIAINRNDVC